MHNRTVELDVRPILRRGEEPFSVIMDSVGKLEEGDIFVLHATMNPVPLLKVLERKGYSHVSEQLAEDHWKVTFEPIPS
ncbi:DUF2249 domain-containing protein [Paenibacillus timonensis]|jgi:uncharacterized protein (DUF2249 family)|uniref:DUF2249 domain-containing protein n=1 Tax=Paenibacillus timonensis TaxID=225915 RepID=A0ABW3SAM3_9BACL|nr:MULTISPECIES: DUF2249 domain-containing protein [Paenibacillus]MCH1640212.1 DUF2249 domain-containing protein [Paenibacillus timonensis]MDU2243326.1 DUF2249 domain-containing protein [Paenibacillus sp.]GJM79730.1 hypothetical protein HMSSN139_22260 [Paenibacillus sp. HMSSN-139]